MYRKVITAHPFLVLKVYKCKVLERCRNIEKAPSRNTGLGMDMITAYDAKKKLSKMECEQLYLRLAYPEKFWKIANHYYNSNKAWVSGRDIEKLEKIMTQEKARQQFLQMLFYFVK